MPDRKVVYMSDVKMGGPMADRIEAAKKKAEAELAEKVQKSRASDVDVRSFFSDEELDALISKNEMFVGHIADLSRMERYKRACAAAKWLDDHSIEVVSVDFEGVSPSKPNAVISMEIRRLASLRDLELKMFTYLSALSDSVFLSGIKDGVIRFTYGVEEIWKE